MRKEYKTKESKGDEKTLVIADVIIRLSKEHNVPIDEIMIGFVDGDKTSLYVWKWRSSYGSGEFTTLEIIDLNGL